MKQNTKSQESGVGGKQQRAASAGMKTVTKQRGSQSPEQGTRTMKNDTKTNKQQGGAQMRTHTLDRLASLWLQNTDAHFSRHRGVQQMEDGTDAGLLVFGNDGYSKDPLVVAEANAMRAYCQRKGWATSDVFVEGGERYSWCFWTLAPVRKKRALFEKLYAIWWAMVDAVIEKKAGRGKR